MITLALFLSDTTGYRLKQKDADEDTAMAALEQAIQAETGVEAESEVTEKEAPAAAAAPVIEAELPEEETKKGDDVDSLMEKYDNEEENKKFKKSDKFKQKEKDKEDAELAK